MARSPRVLPGYARQRPSSHLDALQPPPSLPQAGVGTKTDSQRNTLSFAVNRHAKGSSLADALRACCTDAELQAPVIRMPPPVPCADVPGLNENVPTRTLLGKPARVPVEVETVSNEVSRFGSTLDSTCSWLPGSSASSKDQGLYISVDDVAFADTLVNDGKQMVASLVEGCANSSGSTASSAHSALLEASLSSQAEHERLRQARNSLQQETVQLKALVARWQKSYEVLEGEHLETCGRVQDAVEQELQQLQEEKKFQLAEIEKLQIENTALREENQALQKREARLIEHNSQVFRQNEKLFEVLSQTRDCASPQATPPSSIDLTPWMSGRAHPANPDSSAHQCAFGSSGSYNVGSLQTSAGSSATPRGEAVQQILAGMHQNQELMEMLVVKSGNTTLAREAPQPPLVPVAPQFFSTNSRSRMLSDELQLAREAPQPPLAPVAPPTFPAHSLLHGLGGRSDHRDVPMCVTVGGALHDGGQATSKEQEQKQVLAGSQRGPVMSQGQEALLKKISALASYGGKGLAQLDLARFGNA